MEKNNVSHDIFIRLQEKKHLTETSISKNDIDTILNELDVYETELLAQNDELKQQQIQLQDAFDIHELLFDNASTPHILIDAQHTVKKFNKIADELLSFPKFSSHKISFDMYLAKNQLTKVYDWIDYKKYEDQPVLLELKCADKSIKKFRVHGDLYPHSKYWIMLTLHDVTKEYTLIDEIRELEKQKYEQQRLLLTQSKVAAVGEMLGNIAHQWRQPLNMITTHTSGLRLQIDLNETIDTSMLKECAKDVEAQAVYLSKTIDDFMGFFKSDLDSMNKFNIQDTLMTMYNLVIESLKNNFIECDKSFEDVFIYNNETMLIQALLNMCNNAKDAMVANIEDTSDRYFFVSLKKDNDKALITFRDSGGGVDKEIVDKIFEPYFTTKHQSVGTGIGLYMTNQIITKHYKGSIQIENVEYEYNKKMQKGAEFQIILPVSNK